METAADRYFPRTAHPPIMNRLQDARDAWHRRGWHGYRGKGSAGSAKARVCSRGRDHFRTAPDQDRASRNLSRGRRNVCLSFRKDRGRDRHQCLDSRIRSRCARGVRPSESSCATACPAAANCHRLATSMTDWAGCGRGPADEAASNQTVNCVRARCNSARL